MNRSRWHVALCLGAFLAAAPGARAQFLQRDPHVGYVYPAGGRRSDAFEVTIGGEFLDGVTDVYVSGEGVRASVVKHTKPLTPKQLNELRNKLEEVRERVQAFMRNSPGRGRPGSFQRTFVKIAEEMGVDSEDLKALDDFRKQRSDPKRQLNPQIAERVTLQVELAPDAEPGERELRLKTPRGLSNPLSFRVGQWPEHQESEPNDQTPDDGIRQPLPVIVNGQIMPGDVDRFSFNARQGQRLVVAASARELIPYLADAVPGWFQAALALYDAEGRELAFADDYRFHPDPVLFYEIPEDGRYVLEIKDAIYRGREDFVYRIALGEMPFVTGVFPLGGRGGQQTAVELKGWNLPVDRLTLETEEKETGILPVSVRREDCASNHVPFAVDTLPECPEKEPNNGQPDAQQVALPVIVNGRVGGPGDWDVFRFEGRAGDEIVAEVYARRLDSPLDSLLKLTDSAGRQLAMNDDHEDKGSGLNTHHADSLLTLTLPADGAYEVHLGDTQHKGGAEYAYRLRLGPPRPDFELRVVPSSINARAGATVPITVYAMRRDGFSGDIALELVDAPQEFALSGAWVPAKQDKVRLTLTVPRAPSEEPYHLRLKGRAVIQGREVCRSAVPAEDMMQAFIYRHLVPAKDLMVAVTGGRRFRAPLRLLETKPVELAPGEMARVRFFAPGVSLADQIRLELSEPPEGIAIHEVAPTPQGVVILLSADAGKVQEGLKGNLIVDAFVERPASREAGGPQGNRQRFPVGTLPAIPFEVVASQPLPSSDLPSPVE